MIDDGLGDWRIAQVTTLAKDIPSAYIGGPSHKAGTPVYLSHLAKHKEYRNLGFITPSAPALSLSIAFQSSGEANMLKSTLDLKDTVTPSGKGKAIADEDLPQLYDFFQHCMIAVTFSFQALETFANSEISRMTQKKIKVKRREGIVEITSAEAERNLSTSEKLSQILPDIFNVPSPKGLKPWEGFRTLKKVRDSTIHLKSADMYARKEIDRESLFYRFINWDSRGYPRFSYQMILYYFQNKEIPRWLDYFGQQIGK